MRSGQYDLPKAVVAKDDHWREKHDLLPPDLSDCQIAEMLDEVASTEDDMRPAGPKATAVILRKLAAVVIVPDREDMDLAMEAYLDDLQGYPDFVLEDVAKQWRRTEKFWPTIAEFRALCDAHRHGLGHGRAELRSLYRFMAIAERPAPNLLVTSGWVSDIDKTRDQMVDAFNRFKPRKDRERIEAQPRPRLASVAA